MFKATEFFYDGIASAQYGLKIASFDDSPTAETAYVSGEVALSKAAKSPRYYYLDTKYETPPEFEFSVISELPIPQTLLSEILVWLDARRGFKPLVIMQPGYEDLTYNCIFNVTNLLYHGGDCVGLSLRAQFDSNYVFGTPTTISHKGDGTACNVVLFNRSDNIDHYVYPTVKFTVANPGGTKSEDPDGEKEEERYDVKIINKTDDVNRVFLFHALGATEYTIDNELRIIRSDIDGNNLLEQFEGMKWLRMLRGKNEFEITINGTITITCPKCIKISF